MAVTPCRVRANDPWTDTLTTWQLLPFFQSVILIYFNIPNGLYLAYVYYEFYHLCLREIENKQTYMSEDKLKYNYNHDVICTAHWQLQLNKSETYKINYIQKYENNNYKI